MTKPTRPEVEVILARCKAATPGPWTRDLDGWSIYDADNKPFWRVEAEEYEAEINKADAVFIAASRTDVEALCEYVLALEAQVKTAKREAYEHAIDIAVREAYEETQYEMKCCAFIANEIADLIRERMKETCDE